MAERSKERAWLYAEIHELLRITCALPDTPGATLDTVYQWFVSKDAQAWSNGWLDPGGWGRFFTYSAARRRTMVREELQRLIDHGRIVKVSVAGEGAAWWQKKTKAPKKITVYKVVGLLDAIAHAAKRRPAELVRAQ